VFFDPFHNFAEMLVLLANVVFFTEIDEVHYWLCCKEEQRIDYLDLRYSCQLSSEMFDSREEVGCFLIRTGFLSHNALCVYM